MLALKAENISKQYRLGQVGTGTLSHDLNRFWHTIRGKEDPYLKIGETNDRSIKGSSDYVWSLRDINFEIEQGDAVGIIGRNGAGKSTLLKVLSKVTKPTTGKIYTNGRIASLLEVGTGFHPEMTGRENVFLNGAILGMTRKEITRKFDEIVAFSGVERYIDTPVKRYSSGMYVRLAFAVAAHLESEILIVDEVLAVGDAEFQKKCLGKMGDVTKGEGRTILFVSHNMSAISQLCTTGIFMKNGSIVKNDSIKVISDLYLKDSEKGNSFFIAEGDRNETVFFKKISVLDSNENPKASFDYHNEIIINFEITNKANIKNANIFVTIQDTSQNRVFSAEVTIKEDKNDYRLVIEPQFLSAGSYNITCFLHIPNLLRYDELQNICHFDVIDTGSQFVIHGGYHHGVVYGKFEWK
ncbi:ABC transporter ATP-binding protein [Chryseobacterium gwangjuense]|uniref:ABC transporter ATP-binding protein n=1 Tax=Chryseobacterium gwangjuense TaxID=1069980 RepID=UPI001E457C5C|nr:ABC transporter ATP-binding protein [Chryseobacterium gwangjuense]MCE3075441.1 ABC transporter ATP-binding protein [Chryseobacterium gwangjuense]